MTAASVTPPTIEKPARHGDPAQHGMGAHSHGAGVVPVQTRSERFRSREVEDFPPVSTREAQWRYTPVSRLATLTSGDLDGSRYELKTELPDGVTAEWVDRSDERIGRAGAPEDRASANAWSSFREALVVTVTGEQSEPVVIDRSGLGSTPRAAHTIVETAPFSKATVILRNTGEAQLAENLEIVVGDSSKLTLVAVQEWEDTALHACAHFATVGQDAYLKHVMVSLGGDIVRVNPSTVLAGRGADTDALGVYFSDAGQHIEHQVFVHHEGANTRSRVSYKGALQGKDARTVWIGDVLIGPHASGTDSYEQNRNLVLTEGTRADSVPNLEIETGDIVGAGHASATGRFDDEQLFYLQSRGIPEDEARRLVVRGFLIDIVQRIGVPQIEEHLSERIEHELSMSARMAATAEA